jgi:undecaprenyl-diphosphatase
MGALAAAVSLPDHLTGPVVVTVWVGALFALAAVGLAALAAFLRGGEQPSGSLAPATHETGQTMTRASMKGWAPIVASGIVFAAVTVDLAADGPLRHWDRAVIAAAGPVLSPPDVMWQTLADGGSPPTLAAVLIAAIGIHLVGRRGTRPAVLAAGWVVVVAATIWSAKTVIGRTPPWSRVDLLHSGGMSYPSGHSTSAAALLLIAATLATSPGSRADRIANWSAPVLAAVVAIATVRLQYHWPSNAIAGWALGLTLGLMARRSIRRTTRPAAPNGRPSVWTVGSR